MKLLADITSRPLDKPDREGVRSSTGAADVDEGAQRQQRIRRDLSDPSLRPCFRQQRSKISAFERACIFAVPDVVVTLRIEFSVEQSLLLEHIRKPWVVTPVRLHDDGAIRLAPPQEIVDRIALAARI